MKPSLPASHRRIWHFSRRPSHVDFSRDLEPRSNSLIAGKGAEILVIKIRRGVGVRRSCASDHHPDM